MQPMKRTFTLITLLSLSFLLTACYNPPFNDFKSDRRPLGPSSVSKKTMQNTLINDLKKRGIELYQYGQQYTLLVPTDTYFEFNSPHLDEIQYEGLNEMIRLLKTFKYKKIYVAAFTDDVGSQAHKDKLTQARAETMLTFLWSFNISAEKLKAEGYGDGHPIGDNHFIRSSAYNRRIEIQWTPIEEHHEVQPAAQMMTK